MAPSGRLNVLIYSGPGVSAASLSQALLSLRSLLAPRYAVHTITPAAILSEPWPSSTALLVFPGGADRAYCSSLNGHGNTRIHRYVEAGGSYLGFCAGGYYGTARCEFEVGNKIMEVIGPRELALFPGTCRGGAFKGFSYNSELGTRAAAVQFGEQLEAGQQKASILPTFHCYCNGGGVFVDAGSSAMREKKVDVLARYTESLDVDAGEDGAAVVLCHVGEGRAVLTGPHPEFSPSRLARNARPDFNKVVDAITASDAQRIDFLRRILSELGLKANEEQGTVPRLTPMYLSSSQPGAVIELLYSIREIVTEESGRFIHDDNDIFQLHDSGSLNMADLQRSLPSVNETEAQDERDDPTKAVKQVIVYESIDQLPTKNETPRFDHVAYFKHLRSYQKTSGAALDTTFGSTVLYGEVVTSTNTLLEKNTQLLRRLPAGFLATANVQIAGRGRGSNIWVSPSGSLMFSIVVRHETELIAKAPVIFLQYLAAMAVVQGVHSYDAGYDGLPVRLKWPNDIYALDTAQSPGQRSYVKIGGVLVNSHYSASEYISVIGVGVNTTNTLPTTSLAALLPPKLPVFTSEKLLARIVTTFSSLYSHFRAHGFDARLEHQYYQAWLHSDQVVTLEAEGGIRARIKGLTTDWGFLKAEELGASDRSTGRMVQLQPDSNSFDFFKGLVKRKI